MLLSHFGVSAANLMKILVYLRIRLQRILTTCMQILGLWRTRCMCDVSVTYLCAWRMCSVRHDTVTNLLRYSKAFNTYVWPIYLLYTTSPVISYFLGDNICANNIYLLVFNYRQLCRICTLNSVSYLSIVEC